MPGAEHEEVDRPSLEIEDLRKRFGRVTAIDGLSLVLGAGELLAGVGPSGCGKATLLRTVAGLVAADSGRVTLGGRLVDDGAARIPPERRGVGLVFQDHALFPHLTVRDNVGFGIRRDSGFAAGERVDQMLGLVGLPDHGARYPHELSGGERQRVALARALAPAPALMLFDEPFASIDHNLRVRLREDVVEALRATTTPALFVTHDQAEALAIGDRIAVMRAGELVQLDTPSAVFHRPADRFVGAFMGEASFLPVLPGPEGPCSRLGPIDSSAVGRSPAGEGMVAMVRPHDLGFTPDPTGDATVVSTEYRGSEWLLAVELPDGPVLLVADHDLEGPAVGAPGRVHLVAGRRQILVPTDGQTVGELVDISPEGQR